MLLSAAIFLTKGKIIIGMTFGNDLLGKKKHKSNMESYTTRKRKIEEFVKKIDPKKEVIVNIVSLSFLQEIMVGRSDYRSLWADYIFRNFMSCNSYCRNNSWWRTN